MDGQGKVGGINNSQDPSSSSQPASTNQSKIEPEPQNDLVAQNRLQVNRLIGKESKVSHLEPLLDKEGRAVDESDTVELARIGHSHGVPARHRTDHIAGDQQPNSLVSSQVNRVGSFSGVSTNSQLFGSALRRQNQTGVKLELRQTWWDHLKIFMYHFIEPLLLAVAMSICLQLPTLSTLIYILVMFLGILPMILSSNQTNIKFKWFMSFLMLIIALPLFIFKLVMIIKYKKHPENFEDKEEMWKFLGVYTNNAAVTLIIDVFQMVITLLLIWHLSDQRDQATQRMKANMISIQDFQTKVKLHHPFFGRKHNLIFTISYFMYLIDCFIMLSFPQLFIIMLLISIMFFWERIVTKRHWTQMTLMRLIQVLSIIQVLAAFFIQLPIVADKWLEDNVTLSRMLGLEGTEDKKYEVYARFHYVALCLAVVSTEVYIVSSKIYDRQVQRVQKATEIGDLRNMAHFGKNNHRDSTMRAGSFKSNPQFQRMTSFVPGQLGEKSEHTEQQQRIQRSKLLTQKSSHAMADKETSFWAQMYSWWLQIKASTVIWFCRLISFIWVYTYHDIQSVVMLMWLLHSTIFSDSGLFKKWMVYFYMPAFTLIYLWYYVTNIFGLLNFWEDSSDPYKTIDMYVYGFFHFQIPFLEISFMYVGLAMFTVLVYQLEGEQDKKFEKQLTQKIGNRSASLGYQFLFLFLIYIEFPMMLFLVIAGLDKMDVYHITMLFFFVWYTLSPRIIQKTPIILLIYANVFVLEKYVYTLFHVKENPSNWVEIMGFSTDYDYHQSKEYFRYPPKFDQWVLVFLTFCLYRRQSLLGTDDKLQFDEYKRLAENQIKLRLPRFYQVYIIIDIIYGYSIVILAFTLYLVIVVLIPSSLINAITQTLVLILLSVYLSKGIRELLGYWKILIFYQAIVLCLMVIFQFLVQAPDFDDSKIHNYFSKWPSWWASLLKWSGFTKFDDPINLQLLPYVVFFSLAIILSKNFRSKQQIEMRELYTEDDIEQKDDQFGDQSIRPTILANYEQAVKTKRLEQMMRADPSGDFEHIEPELVYNYGNISGYSKDVNEILHHKQMQGMKYKLTYMTYKIRKAWPVFDILAAYSYIVLYVTILAFALYQQLAVFWAIALSIYMVAQFINSSSHYNYRQKGRTHFIEKLDEAESGTKMTRLLQTEQQVLDNRKTVYIENLQRRKQIDEIRQSKNQIYTPVNPGQGMAYEEQPHNSARFAVPDLAEKLQTSQSTQLLSLPQEQDEFHLNPETIHKEQEEFGNEGRRTMRRLKVTDQEVLDEIKAFNEQIHKVSLKSRNIAWVSLMVLVIVGLFLIYVSSFADLYEDDSETTTPSPFNDYTKQRLLFLFFWSGVYADPDYESYSSGVYPFYLILVMLIFERLALMWIETRFGCTKELIKKFKQVEKQDKIYKDQAIERRKNARKSRMVSMKSNRLQQRGSIVSAATNSEDDLNSHRSNSFQTDSEFKSKASQSLGTIEEEKIGDVASSFHNSVTNGQSHVVGSDQEASLLLGPDAGEPKNSHDSINQSFHDKPQIQVSNADKLIIEQRMPPLLIVDDVYPMNQQEQNNSNLIVSTDGTTYKSSDFEKRNEMKKKLLDELKPLLNVKSRVRCSRALKKLLENFCILLVWFSTIYKQNILSMFLFLFLVIYTYHRSANTLLLVRSTVVVVFVLQYWLEVGNLSHYNSPKVFPKHLIGDKDSTQTVYPNPDRFYYDIPFIMAYNQTTNEDGTLNATANLNYASYLAMDTDNRKLNGVWIDFMMTVFVSIYFSLCNFWMLFRPIKIENSDATEQKLKEYNRILRSEEKGRQFKNTKLLKKDLQMQFGMTKMQKSWTETIYTTFPILLIAFTLAISIFNQSILSFGYIIFVMVLVVDNIKFLKDIQDKNRLETTLKYFMLPYLLVDIFLQLVYQMPFDAFQDEGATWSLAIGFQRVWNITPSSLVLGEDVSVDYVISNSLTTMMLKGLTFFFITIQLQLIQSYQYQKFMQKRLEKQHELTEKTGKGITYRFNNFKSKAVLKHAQETQKVERMLAHTKRMIKRREAIYKNAKSNNQMYKGYRDRADTMHSSDERQKQQVIHERSDFSESDSNDDKAYEKRLNSRQKHEKEIVKADKDVRMKKLNCCNKLYLWIRRYLVVDILFYTSEEHLDDTVHQMKNGQTSVKTSIEIGLYNLSKQKRKEEIYHELEELIIEQQSNKIKARQQDWKVDGAGQDKDETVEGQVIEEEGTQVIAKSQTDEQLSALTIAMKNEARNDDQDKALNTMMEDLDQNTKIQEKEDKNLLQDLWKSKVFKEGFKNWQIVNMEKFLTWQASMARYFVVFYKIIVSYSELLCYMMMLLATFMKAGLLYMVYPVSIFGYCMLEEQRPGRLFWFFILFYTQILIIINFAVQLQLWYEVLDEQQLIDYSNFFESNRLGITKIQGNNFSDTFVFYFPEIFILFTTLVHIQKESLSGVFNVPYESYENFEAGLLRYRLQRLCNTEKERMAVNSQFQNEEALKVELNKNTIDPFLYKGYASDYDKFQFSEELRDPIRREKLFADPLTPFGEPDMINDYVYRDYNRAGSGLDSADMSDGDNPEDLRAILDDYHGETPVDLTAEQQTCFSEDNIASKNRQRSNKKLSYTQWAQWLFFDNSFLTRLFPEIKQQKPGYDLYVYVATIQIIVIAYVFLFYSQMIGTESDIATQFATNQYSKNMVLVLICMIIIMIVDRVLYSTHAFMSGNKKYDADSKLPLQSETRSTVTGAKVDPDMSTISDGDTLNQRRPTIDGGQGQSNWIDDQFAISDHDSSDEEADLFVFNNYLVPQRQQRTYKSVIKFYWFWVTIILAHYFVFFGLPATVQYCKASPQVDKETGEQINYGQDAYVCNTFTNNGWIIVFYLFLCVYFAVQAYQMRIGLPEIRKGSFLMDSFNPVSGVIYRGYLAIPFIFELRTLIDWTFTTTSLDAFQWIKLAQIQANMYVAKCVNKDYMERELGTKIKKWEKILIGFGLVLFIILMIVGPIILFSNLNPIATIDKLTGGTLEASLSFSNSSSSTNQTLPLFTTAQVTQIKQLTSSQEDALNFNGNTETDAFQLNQISVIQFSETSDIAWIVSTPKKTDMTNFLQQLIDDELPEEITLYYSFNWKIDREESQYGDAKSGYIASFTNSTDDKDLAQNLVNQISCTESQIESYFPAKIYITQKTNQDTNTIDIRTTDDALRTNYTLTYYCDKDRKDMINDYWSLQQDFTTNSTYPYPEEVAEMQDNVFSGEGFGFFIFQQKVLPGFFAQYSSNLVVFYVGIVFVIATIFRSVLVPRTWEIYIIDAPHTEDILKICQSIHVYRVQRDLVKEEELYQILIDIMRSPEMIKALTKTSQKERKQQ